jgi:hypothetical protein
MFPKTTKFSQSTPRKIYIEDLLLKRSTVTVWEANFPNQAAYSNSGYPSPLPLKSVSQAQNQTENYSAESPLFVVSIVAITQIKTLNNRLTKIYKKNHQLIKKRKKEKHYWRSDAVFRFYHNPNP